MPSTRSSARRRSTRRGVRRPGAGRRTARRAVRVRARPDRPLQLLAGRRLRGPAGLDARELHVPVQRRHLRADLRRHAVDGRHRHVPDARGGLPVRLLADQVRVDALAPAAARDRGAALLRELPAAHLRLALDPRPERRDQPAAAGARHRGRARLGLPVQPAGRRAGARLPLLPVRGARALRGARAVRLDPAQGRDGPGRDRVRRRSAHPHPADPAGARDRRDLRGHPDAGRVRDAAAGGRDEGRDGREPGGELLRHRGVLAWRGGRTPDVDADRPRADRVPALARRSAW